MSYVTNSRFIVGVVVGVALAYVVIPFVMARLGGARGGRGQAEY